MMKFIVTVFTLISEIIIAKELVTHVDLFPGTEYRIWEFKNNYLNYFAVEGDVFRYEVRVVVIDDIFTSSSQTFNCSFVVYDNKYPLLHMSVVRRLDEKKILIVPLIKLPEWQMILIDLLTCDVVGAEDPILSDDVFASDSSYDIITINSTLCGIKYCKITVDSRLNVVDGPVPWVEQFGNYLHRVKLKEDSDGDERDLVYQVLMEKDQIIRRFSLAIKNELKTLVERDSPYLSVSYDEELLGFVFSNDQENNGTSLDVYQFSLNGHKKVHITLQSNTVTKYAQIKNLPGGGFLLAIGINNESNFLVRVVKYDVEGQPVLMLELQGFEERDRPDIIDPLFYFREDNEENMNCIIQMRQGKMEKCGDERCTEIFEKCFREEDLGPLPSAAAIVEASAISFLIILLMNFYL